MAIKNNDPKKLFANSLNLLLKAKKITAFELADVIGVGSNTISTWRTQSRFPGAESLEQVANFFCLPVAWFFQEHTSEDLRFFEEPTSSLKIFNDDMAPVLLPNDVVVFRLTSRVENGSLAVVNIDTSLYVRRIHFTGETITLSCANPAYAPIVYPKNAAPSIIGEVIKFERNF